MEEEVVVEKIMELVVDQEVEPEQVVYLNQVELLHNLLKIQEFLI